MNYRILYSFRGKNTVVLAHALAKGDAVPQADIERALQRMQRVLDDPRTHIHEG